MNIQNNIFPLTNIEIKKITKKSFYKWFIYEFSFECDGEDAWSVKAYFDFHLTDISKKRHIHFITIDGKKMYSDELFSYEFIDNGEKLKASIVFNTTPPEVKMLYKRLWEHKSKVIRAEHEISIANLMIPNAQKALDHELEKYGVNSKSKN